MINAIALSGFAFAMNDYRFVEGDESLQSWLLPDQAPYPEGNKPTKERIELGKMLFFDPRLSGDKNMSCATCHNPSLGWSDGLPTAKGVKSKVLPRATPTIVNTAFNPLQMWDGREKTLESQALGPIKSKDEMNMDLTTLIVFLKSSKIYSMAFKKAYPDEPINDATIAKALASFERTVISNKSSFDRWIAGETNAMSQQQIKGFKLFVDPQKGNCEVCHSAPNFTDNGFHNLGLVSFGEETPDLGRYEQKPIGLMKGAFKTPTLRDVELTAPYFHDGSSATLHDVVKYYVKGGQVTTNLSPNFKPANLTDQEIDALIAFMKALTSPHKSIILPSLPL